METAFVEAFGGKLAVTADDLAASEMWALFAGRSARLIDLTGEALASLGLDARISAADHAPARAWSRAFYEHPSRPDGILYRSRRDPSQLAVALYDRDPWEFELARRPAAALIQLALRYGLGTL